MASASYSEDLTCAICLTIFTDPVNLPCGHSFCRECCSGVLSSQCPQCPQCRAAVPMEVKCLPTSHILKSLAERAKEADKIKTERGEEKAKVVELCPEHEEKLKLFCVTDQQLACIICRDGEKHEGHKFKPVKEAAVSLRKELETFVKCVSDDIHAIESQANTQREEMTKTKEKSQQLDTQIHRQFEEIHQFLRKREDEIRNALKYKEHDDVKKMSESLNVIETSLSESRELLGKVTAVLEIEDSERFLKSWTESNSMATAKRSFMPRGKKITVVNTSLSLGPYESHLQFFMWKEMLQVIQPRAEQLSLRDYKINVSEDKRSLVACQFESNYSYDSDQSNYLYDFIPKHVLDTNNVPYSTESTNQFESGQHYWEVDVGKINNWELGVQKYFLQYQDRKYAAYSKNTSTALTFEGRPRKIGIYLNCTSKELSFYDADNMTHIHTVSAGYISMPLSAYFKVIVNNTCHNPMTVCWY